MWKPLPSRHVSKNLEGKLEKKISKKTISTSSGLGLLQIVLEPDTEQCANEDTKPWRGVDTEQCHSFVGQRKQYLLSVDLGLGLKESGHIY